MATVIRTPRMSSEAVVLAVPRGAGATSASAERVMAKTPLQPVPSVADDVIEAKAERDESVDTREMELLKEELASQKALAEVLKSELDAHAESASKSGYEKGYQLGLDEGRLAGKKEQQSESAALKQAVEQLKTMSTKVLQQAEDDLVAMAYEAVCKIVGEAVISEQAVKAAVTQVAKRREELGLIGIRFSSHDYEALKAHYERNPEQRPAGIDIAVDESIELGGCTVETKTGMLQARLDDQLEQLKKLLLAARNERP